MSTSIAFLSGKGGSGKTTLALSMADLLCRCGIRTLLVDCDLSTNGATYFYEARLAEQAQGKYARYISFRDILSSSYCSQEVSALKIKPNLEFIPSIPEISDQFLTDGISYHSSDLSSQLKEFLSSANRSYDVVLFDCQAGYTEILPALLPLMDVDLFILEADSISASAMRSLHLKIGSSLGHARLYQIFNKATPEEFEIYSKIVGTFFTNIGTLLFDWKIRQAFSRSQIPDLENTSAKYGIDLCGICSIILPDEKIKKNLEMFSNRLLYQQLEEKRMYVEEKLYDSAAKPRTVAKILAISILGIVLSATTLLFESFRDTFFSKYDSILIVVAAMISLCAMLLITATDTFRENRKIRQKRERELKAIDAELEKLSRICRENTGDT